MKTWGDLMDKKIIKEKRASSRKLFRLLFFLPTCVQKIKQGNKVERRKKMRKSVNISWSHVKENYVKSWFTSMERIFPLIGLYPHRHILKAVFGCSDSFFLFSSLCFTIVNRPKFLNKTSFSPWQWINSLSS